MNPRKITLLSSFSKRNFGSSESIRDLSETALNVKLRTANIYSLMQPFVECLLLPSTVLGTEDTSVNETMTSVILDRETDNKHGKDIHSAVC